MKARADIVTAAVLGGIFLGLYLLTVPGNHSEADHAFRYAWDVENAPLHETLHRHRVMYVPLAKAVYGAVRPLNATVRAYPVMIGISMTAGVLALALLYLTLRQHLGFRSETAFFAAGLVGATYGFWRYACEAEIPVVAAAPLALGIYLLTAPRPRALGVIGAAMAGALAVSLHVLAIIPALFAFPFLLMGRGRRGPLLGYVLLLMALVVAGYTVADTSPLAPAAHSQAEFGDVHLALQGPSALGNGILGFGRALLSGNYLFCVHPFREFMERVFSHRLLREELLIGIDAGTAAAVLPLTILFLLGLVVVFVVDDRLNPPHADEDNDAPPPHPCALMRRVTLLAMVTWFVLHALFLLGYEPANPEGWILVCLPFWMGLVLLWARDPRGIPPQALGTLFILLLLHNYFGGMKLIAGEAGDYNRRTAQWVIDHARADDVILTDETTAYCWHLRYHTPARIVWLPRSDSPQELVETLERVRREGGHVLATPDVFAAEGSARHGAHDEPERVRRVRDALRPLFKPVTHNRFGHVWLFRPELADQ